MTDQDQDLTADDEVATIPLAFDRYSCCDPVVVGFFPDVGGQHQHCWIL